MHTTLDIYNEYDKNIELMIDKKGRNDLGNMVVFLTGPYAVARAISEFFGYKYARNYKEGYSNMGFYDIDILLRIIKESKIPGTRSYQIA